MMDLIWVSSDGLFDGLNDVNPVGYLLYEPIKLNCWTLRDLSEIYRDVNTGVRRSVGRVVGRSMHIRLSSDVYGEF